MNGNSFSSLAAAETKDLSAALGGASFSEAVDAGSMDFAGLPGAFGHRLMSNEQETRNNDADIVTRFSIIVVEGHWRRIIFHCLLFSAYCCLFWVFWVLTECGKVTRVGNRYEARRGVEKCQG